MPEPDASTTLRTYPFGARGRQIIDSVSILMPSISKAKIMNAALFHMVDDMNKVIRENPGMNVREAFERVMEPVLQISYEDLLKAVSPIHSNQTPLDDYIGISIIRTRPADIGIRDEDAEGEELVEYIYSDRPGAYRDYRRDEEGSE